ncbi:hypothetical protein SAMN05421762_1552 [Pseudooceanicola nitratireducens]|jgi:hypothetical protein|uniref:Uncharacterized protein n=1 Tax=Pseudooceanicola nitratireducens TaxID=517719 RepID=A0A1I1KU77_9RHOB|nr:hypothetical protein SAMN05216183_103243 [Pseudooceanicola nitratireducens]SFC61693.1 hypothetical protein SAMN05421762_1552 [Pseudooceanicola nitratireducens]
MVPPHAPERKPHCEKHQNKQLVNLYHFVQDVKMCVVKVTFCVS